MMRTQIDREPIDGLTEYLEPEGVWRDLNTGINPNFGDPEWADGATDQPGDFGEPITTRLEGPWGLPWFEGIEDPKAVSGLFSSPNPSYPYEDLGAEPIVGAYEPAVRTLGPVQAWGHEPSGGIYGDQAIGRIQRFPANIPERYDRNGVWNIDYRDELAAVLAYGNQPIVSDAEVTTSLVLGPGIGEYYTDE